MVGFIYVYYLFIEAHVSSSFVLGKRGLFPRTENGVYFINTVNITNMFYKTPTQEFSRELPLPN